MENEPASLGSADHSGNGDARSQQIALRLLLWGLAVAGAIAIVGSLLFLNPAFRDFPYNAF